MSSHQLLGFEVDAINSVQFSNHTGYKSWTGEKLTEGQLESLLDGLEGNGLLEYTHLLTGMAPGFDMHLSQPSILPARVMV